MSHSGNGFGGRSLGMFSNWGGQNDTNKLKPDNQNQHNQNNNTNNNSNNNTDNNSVTDDDKLLNEVWSQNQADTSGGDGENKNQNNNNQNQNNQNQNNQVNPDQVLQSHLKEIGLEPFTLTDEEIEGIKDGTGINALISRINKQNVSSYLASMKNMDQLIKQRVEAGIKQANENTQNTLQGIDLKNYLETNIPYVKGNSLLGPVAETAFKAFYNKTNGDKERAIRLTKRFLEETADTVNSNDPNRQDNFNRGSFRGNPNVKDDGAKDWIEVLRSK